MTARPAVRPASPVRPARPVVAAPVAPARPARPATPARPEATPPDLKPVADAIAKIQGTPARPARGAALGGALPPTAARPATPAPAPVAAPSVSKADFDALLLRFNALEKEAAALATKLAKQAAKALPTFDVNAAAAEEPIGIADDDWRRAYHGAALRLYRCEIEGGKIVKGTLDTSCVLDAIALVPRGAMHEGAAALRSGQIALFLPDEKGEARWDSSVNISQETLGEMWADLEA